MTVSELMPGLHTMDCGYDSHTMVIATLTYRLVLIGDPPTGSLRSIATEVPDLI